MSHGRVTGMATRQTCYSLTLNCLWKSQKVIQSFGTYFLFGGVPILWHHREPVSQRLERAHYLHRSKPAGVPVLRQEMDLSPCLKPEVSSNWKPHTKEKFDFFPVESHWLDPMPSSGCPTQKQTHWYFWRVYLFVACYFCFGLFESECCRAFFLTLQVFCL